MIRVVLLVAVLMLVSGSAGATLRGDQLLWKCDGTAASDAEAVVGRALCAGYVSGFLDSYRVVTSLNHSSPAICFPDSGISNDQAIRIVVKYLEEHPEDLHKTARVSVFLALRAAFPCKP